MNRKNMFIALALLIPLVLLFIMAGTAQSMSSTNYRLEWGTFSGGGGVVSSTNYRMGYSIGQGVIGVSQSTNYRLGAGFWEAVTTANQGTGAHTVPTPSTPSNLGYYNSSFLVGEELTFETTGGWCSLGHGVKFIIDWGDGSPCSESDYGGFLNILYLRSSHVYTTEGTYEIRAQSLCGGGIFSAWSEAKTVHIYSTEEISTPEVPFGPGTAYTGNANFVSNNLDYTTHGASSNLGHTVEYRFDWGNGTMSAWVDDIGLRSQHPHYFFAGTYHIRAQARCRTHTGVLSAWSNDKTVVITNRAGDANVDGIVDAVDITKTERIIGGLDAQTPGADANNDSNVNALDITKVERIIAELE